MLNNLSSFLFISFHLCDYLNISPFPYLYISLFLYLYISLLSLSDLAAVVLGFIRLLPTDLHEETTLWIHWPSWRFNSTWSYSWFSTFIYHFPWSKAFPVASTAYVIYRCKSIYINTIASRCLLYFTNDVMINIIYFKYKI